MCILAPIHALLCETLLERQQGEKVFSRRERHDSHFNSVCSSLHFSVLSLSAVECGFFFWTVVLEVLEMYIKVQV